MQFRKLDSPRRREPDLTSLINIVFLILIFFIVAGTLRPFTARDVTLVKVQPDVAGVAVPAKLIVFADGGISYRGELTSLENLGTSLQRDSGVTPAKPLTIVADARLDARRLLEIVRAVRRLGIEDISLLTQRLKDG